MPPPSATKTAENVMGSALANAAFASPGITWLTNRILSPAFGKISNAQAVGSCTEITITLPAVAPEGSVTARAGTGIEAVHGAVLFTRNVLFVSPSAMTPLPAAKVALEAMLVDSAKLLLITPDGPVGPVGPVFPGAPMTPCAP